MVAMFIALIFFMYLTQLLFRKEAKDTLIMLVYVANNKYKHKSQYYLKTNFYYHIH